MQSEPVNQSAPRKQNIACDACRTRKVKCVMNPGQEKCQHCQAKSYPCTFNVQRETSEKKRQGTQRRRNSGPTTGTVQTHPAVDSLSHSVPPPVSQSPTYPHTNTSQATPLAPLYSDAYHPLPPRSQTHTLHQPLEPSSAPQQPPAPSFDSSALAHSPSPAPHPETSTTRLLAYLFSSESPSPLYFESPHGYRALPDYQQRHRLTPEDWGDVGIKLQDPAFRIEFALDLVEVYFEIYHSRVALFVPTRFRAQLRASLSPVPRSRPSPASSHDGSLPTSSAPVSPLSHAHHARPRQLHTYQPQQDSQPPVHPSILAAVLALGAKFSEHPLLLLDRSADVSGARRSRLSRSLTRKAWEVAEAERMHIVPSPDAVIVCLLLDALHSHDPNDPDGYRGFWQNCALRHLLHLQINIPSAFHAVDPDRQASMAFAWWVTTLGDAYASLWFRRKPVLEDHDYDIDFYPQEIMPILGDTDPDNRYSILSRPEAWYTASHALARCAREMSRQLWRPSSHSEGVPFEVVCTLMRDLHDWRRDHLEIVGVPATQVNWDFMAAVAACGSDSIYHSMWVILYQALCEFGLREVNETKRSGNSVANHPLAARLANTEAQVHKEAINAASRIAGLTDLLTQSGYLRLDPNIMHCSIYTAGKLLAEFGREEVAMCIRGLQQYGVSYDDAFEQAAELQRLYTASTARVEQPEPVVHGWEGVNGGSHHTSYPLSDGTSYGRTADSQQNPSIAQR